MSRAEKQKERERIAQVRAMLHRVILLWCGTCYPAGDAEQIEKQVERLARKSGAEYEVAMEITHREFDEAWEATRHLRSRWDEEEQRWIEPEELAGLQEDPVV